MENSIIKTRLDLGSTLITLPECRLLFKEIFNKITELETTVQELQNESTNTANRSTPNRVLRKDLPTNNV